MKQFVTRGEPQVWLTAAALSATLLMGLALIIVVLVNGLGTFWPAQLSQFSMHNGQQVLGEVLQQEPLPDGSGDRIQLKVGNRDLYGIDFRWISVADFSQQTQPENVVCIERMEYGNFYGNLVAVVVPNPVQGESESLWQQLEQGRDQVADQQEILDDLVDEVSDISSRIEARQITDHRFAYDEVAENSAERLNLKQQIELLQVEFGAQLAKQRQQSGVLDGYYAEFEDVNGRAVHVELANIVRSYRPNQLSVFDSVVIYADKLLELFIGEPRESNTEGGLFPAIFGTVVLIFVMSIFSFPLGVIAAIYLSEYAGDGIMVRLVRIAVNNLAGIPSIVYGIFGLGFFVYGIGSGIDELFFADRLPTPTFGTGGLLWASLTLALLTVPVVIVTTEEALGAIPGGIREGSLALGSTRFQTLVRILIPMASPGIMTGLILSMARAAGEVAPLMITGVVKLAPALPLDGTFPFFHLERKFMHLGFHIYDIGFQSPNVEAARPMVFVTTLLLVLIVIVMSGVAIRLRNQMKKKYTFGTF